LQQLTDVRFLKSEVVITQPDRNLVLRLDIAKRVLSLKPKPERWICNSMAAIFKILEIDMTVELCREWFRLDEICRRMLNHVEKQQILL